MIGTLAAAAQSANFSSVRLRVKGAGKRKVRSPCTLKRNEAERDRITAELRSGATYSLQIGALARTLLLSMNMPVHSSGPEAYNPLINVLLIEDNPVDADLLQCILSKDTTAFAIHTATSMRAAAERLRAGGIELVLTDLSLPDSRDFDTLSAIQAAGSGYPDHRIERLWR